MPNILKESAAPYALAIIIGVLGWLLNSAITELKGIRYVEYRIDYDDKDGARTATVLIDNRSLSQAVSVGKFDIECVPPEGAEGRCFRALNSQGIAVLFLRRGDVLLSAPASQDVADQVYSVPALIPPRAHVAYRVGLAPDATIRFAYDLKSADPSDGGLSQDTNIIMSSGGSIEGFLLQYYLKILVILSIVFLSLFLIWILVSIVLAIVTRRADHNTVPAPDGNRDTPLRYELTVELKERES